MRRSRKKLVVAIVVVGFLASCTGTACLVGWMFPKHTSTRQPAPDGMDLYTNPVFGYSLHVPRDWSLGENMTPAPSYVVLAAPGPRDGPRIVISTLADPLTMAQRIARLKQQAPDLHVMTSTPITLGGHAGYRLDYRWSGTVRYEFGGETSGARPSITVSVYVLRPKHPLSVRCTCDAEAFESTYQRMFEKTLATLTLFDLPADRPDR